VNLSVNAGIYKIAFHIEGRPSANRIQTRFCSCDLDRDPMTLIYDESDLWRCICIQK